LVTLTTEVTDMTKKLTKTEKAPALSDAGASSAIVLAGWGLAILALVPYSGLAVYRKSNSKLCLLLEEGRR
jgi:hypothetical protein